MVVLWWRHGGVGMCIKTHQEFTNTQVRGGAVDFLLMKKLKKSASQPKESESVCCRLFSFLADYFGGQESDSPKRIRWKFAVDFGFNWFL